LNATGLMVSMFTEARFDHGARTMMTTWHQHMRNPQKIPLTIIREPQKFVLYSFYKTPNDPQHFNSHRNIKYFFSTTNSRLPTPNRPKPIAPFLTSTTTTTTTKKKKTTRRCLQQILHQKHHIQKTESTPRKPRQRSPCHSCSRSCEDVAKEFAGVCERRRRSTKNSSEVVVANKGI
jgi:hypothetical protein